MSEVVARFACNGFYSTPILERTSIDVIPEFECNFYNHVSAMHYFRTRKWSRVAVGLDSPVPG
jgi:hypothetical protein